jgi:orotate phosphoribosyltransferase
VLATMKVDTELAGDWRVQRLKQLIRERGGFKTVGPGEPKFKLASGKESDVYFNGKTVTLHPEGISLISEIIFDKIRDLKVDSIGGLAQGSIPIATAVSLLSFKNGRPIPAFWIRETQKDHGDRTEVEGILNERSQVVVVDDVATTGSSLGKVLDVLHFRHCKVVKIITLLDREEGAEQKFKAMGYDYTYILKKSDFMAS